MRPQADRGNVFALVLATILGCGDLCAPEAVAHYAGLLREGGYGRMPYERGAFLIRERGGAISLQPWESFAFQRATFRGGVPAGTFAIVHTHPLQSRQPSAGDRATAASSGLPVLVITPDGVTGAWPDGSVQRLITQWGWWRSAR